MFDRLVYGFHPYGMPENGTPETLAAITRDDLRGVPPEVLRPEQRHSRDRRRYHGRRGVRTASRRCSATGSERSCRPDSSIAPPDPTRRVIVVNKPDAVQTEVRVGHIGIPRNHPDYMALNLAIRILGGEGANRLHQVLRTERGLTYGAQADMDTLKGRGDFEAETNTRSEATGEVLRLIVDEFWRLQRERVGERELADAKAYMTGSFPLTIETPDAIATQVLNVLFYGLPVEQLQTFRERVNAVTADDIQRVARYVPAAGSAVDCAGRQRGGVSAAAGGARLRHFETIELDDLDLMRPISRTRQRGAAERGAGFAVAAARAGRGDAQVPCRPASPRAAVGRSAGRRGRERERAARPA